MIYRPPEIQSRPWLRIANEKKSWFLKVCQNKRNEKTFLQCKLIYSRLQFSVKLQNSTVA